MKQVNKATDKFRSRPKNIANKTLDNTCNHMLSNDFTREQKKPVYVSVYGNGDVTDTVNENVYGDVYGDDTENVNVCVNERVSGETEANEPKRQERLLISLISQYNIEKDCINTLTDKQLEKVFYAFKESSQYLQRYKQYKNLSWIQENYDDIVNGKYRNDKNNKTN